MKRIFCDCCRNVVSYLALFCFLVVSRARVHFYCTRLYVKWRRQGRYCFYRQFVWRLRKSVFCKKRWT